MTGADCLFWLTYHHPDGPGVVVTGSDILHARLKSMAGLCRSRTRVCVRAVARGRWWVRGRGMSHDQTRTWNDRASFTALTSRAPWPRCPHVPKVSSASRDQRLEGTVHAIRAPMAPFPRWPHAARVDAASLSTQMRRSYKATRSGYRADTPSTMTGRSTRTSLASRSMLPVSKLKGRKEHRPLVASPLTAATNSS
jgi:hypothetical protein